MHHSNELKIKLISLGYESRAIRRIEQKLKNAARNPKLAHLGDERLSLYNHRKELSAHSRNTLLAYGFLKGKPYLSIENKRYSNPNWLEISRMAAKYGPGGNVINKQDFETWKTAAGDPAKRDVAQA